MAGEVGMESILLEVGDVMKNSDDTSPPPLPPLLAAKGDAAFELI